MKNPLIKFLRITFPLLLLGFLIKTVVTNWKEVESYLNDFQLFPLLLSLIVFLLIYPQSALSWYFLIKKLKGKIAVEILNGTGKPGEAGFLQDKLKALGYTKIEVGNATSQNNISTTVTFSL